MYHRCATYKTYDTCITYMSYIDTYMTHVALLYRGDMRSVEWRFETK